MAIRNTERERVHPQPAAQRRDGARAAPAVGHGRDQGQGQAESGGPADDRHGSGQTRPGPPGGDGAAEGDDHDGYQDKAPCHRFSPELVKRLGRQGGSAAVVGPHEDPEGDHGDEEVEQEAHLEDQRHAGGQDQAGDGDAVFHREKAHGLGDDVSPEHDQDERDENGGCCGAESRYGEAGRTRGADVDVAYGEEADDRDDEADQDHGSHPETVAAGQVDLGLGQQVQDHGRDYTTFRARDRPASTYSSPACWLAPSTPARAETARDWKA